MIQENWFYTPVWYAYFQEDLSLAASKCLELRDSGFANRKLSNAGGWQSVNFDLEQFEEFKAVHNIIQICIEEVRVSINQRFKCVLDNAWININERGNFNRPHTHPNSSLSGIVYLQVDDACGRVVFVNSTSLRKHYPLVFDDSNVFSDYAFYTPKNGMALVFPSWAEHYVEESNSDFSRISIAYNIREIQ